MQVLVPADPFVQKQPDSKFGYTDWPVSWIHLPGADAAAPPFVLAYRCRFAVNELSAVRIHVSADERFELFLDGQRIGRGPERGTPDHWFFHSYDLSLTPGEHMLVARVWTLGKARFLAPVAQMAVRPGFVLAAEGAWNDRIGTGVAPWQVKKLGGYQFISPLDFGLGTPFIGAAETIDAATFDWGFERGEGEGWQDAVPVEEAKTLGLKWGEVEGHHTLQPALLPAMMEEARRVGRVRAVETLEAGEAGEDAEAKPIGEGGDTDAWQPVVTNERGGEGGVRVEPRQRIRVLIDLDDYYCAYPELTVSGGRGATVRLRWAEALYERSRKPRGSKGNRDVIDGKYFAGFGDEYRLDGHEARTFSPLWWRAGRYVQLLIETADEPLTVDHFAIRETRYPLERESCFECDETRLVETLPVMVRGMQMCSHETYMDCPYYEQLMYAGDTRLEVLTTYAMTRDPRLPRKAVAAYDWSRRPDGLTQARFPCNHAQVIPPFSLWWVCMVHDYAMWRGDEAFIRSVMPGVRSVMETFRGYFNTDGLVEAPRGWNFVDWEPEWRASRDGAPPDAPSGVSGPVNWQMVLALRAKTELENMLDEPWLAARDEDAAAALTKRTLRAFWSTSRAMLADDLAHTRFSEHSQCLAILSGLLPREEARQAAEALFSADDLARTTIYFSHYLLETCRLTGRMDRFFLRLEEWYDLPRNGLKTTIEHPEPSRSDCHAWGAHPLFHTRATVLGVRPASFGFESVAIRPQLGPLERASGTVPHPRGEITVEVEKQGDRLTGRVRVPEGVGGQVVLADRSVAIEGREVTF